MGLLAVGTGIWIGIGAGVLALLLFLYGFFRRFTRVSWLSWQVMCVFALSLLLRFLPPAASAAVNAAVPPVVLFAAGALVLAVGGWARHGMLAYTGTTGGFIRFSNRFLGGLTAVLNFFLFFGVLALPVLAALPVFGVNVAFLGGMYANPVWTGFAKPYSLDLLVIALFLLAVRCGYRVGLMRALWALITVLLGFGAVVLAVYMVLRVPFLKNWAAGIAGHFAHLGAYASVLGAAVMAAICFVVLLIVVILLSVLINMLMKKLRKPTVLRALDGALLAVVFAALFFLFAFALDLLVYFLAHGAEELLIGEEGGILLSLRSVLGTVSDVGKKLESVFRASPLAMRLYNGNPFLLLLG